MWWLSHFWHFHLVGTRPWNFNCCQNTNFAGPPFWCFSSYRRELCTKWISSSNSIINKLWFTATFNSFCMVTQTILTFHLVGTGPWNFNCCQNKNFAGPLFWCYSSYRRELCTKWICSSNCIIIKLWFTATFNCFFVVAHIILTFSPWLVLSWEILINK